MVNYTLLAGGYTSFITSLLFQSSPASLTVQGTYAAGSSPSWIALSPVNQSIVYATNEVSKGQYLTFMIGKGGALTQHAQISSGGNGPAFATPLSSASQAAVLNYNSGTMEFVSFNSDLVTFSDSTGDPSTITFHAPSGKQSHPHFALQYNDEVFICDLGSDAVWRLSPSTSGVKNAFSITGSIPQPTGSGPRRAVISGNQIYVLHELQNILTQQTIPSSTTSTSAVPITSVLSIVLSNIVSPTNSTYAAGELLSPPTNSMFSTQYLYASNRNTATSPPAAGDSIPIFSTNPLRLVAQVYTGLNQIRGMQFFGPNNQYLVAAGLAGGGTAVFQRTNGGAALQLLARSTDTNAQDRSTFVWAQGV